MIITDTPKHIRMKTGDPLKTIPLLGTFQESDYEYYIEVPHFIMLNRKSATAIFPRDMELNIGEEVKLHENGDPITVEAITERRPAKGTWKQPVDFVAMEFK